MLWTTALVHPNGTTTYPDGQPEACTLCGRVPEFVIEVVKKVAASADVERGAASPSKEEDR
jgi:hypothetical protein